MREEAEMRVKELMGKVERAERELNSKKSVLDVFD